MSWARPDPWPPASAGCWPRALPVGGPTIDYQICEYQIPEAQICAYQISEYQISEYQIPEAQIPENDQSERRRR